MRWLRMGLGASATLLLLACLVVAQTGPGQPGQQADQGLQLVPPPETGAKTGSRLPQIVLKGRVLNKARPPAALLEIDGVMHMVGQGSVLTGQGNIVMRIVEINSSDVRIHVEPFNEFMMLR